MLAGQLAGIESAQQRGAKLTGEDRGRLAAVRRHGGPELVARADAVARAEQVKAEKRAKARRDREQAASAEAKRDRAARRKAERHAFIEFGETL